MPLVPGSLDLGQFTTALPAAVAEAAGLPPPPQPSRVLPVALMGAGGAAVLGGALFGIDGIIREREVVNELKIGGDHPAALKPASAYEDARANIAAQKTMSAISIGVGAALIATGAWVWRSSDESLSAALLVGPNGAAVAGAF